MRTLDRVRALFPTGAVVEVVENTRRPELRGQLRRVTCAHRNALEVEVLNGADAGTVGFRMVLPVRAGDVLELTDTRVRFRFGRDQDTVTFRVTHEEPTDGEADEESPEPEVCEGCGDGLEGEERRRCLQCTNEAAGMCRWCGNKPPAPDNDLCQQCEEEGRRVCAAGSFDSITESPGSTGRGT